MELTSKEQKLTGVKEEPILTDQLFYFRETVSIALKSTGLIIWFTVFILALLEVKQYYNIDVIPGYDSSVDDVYGAVRGTISGLVR